ncbi:hypothetical protein K1T71_005148 [Dendrolimus kikuchii]|uniref:Uncharacterized protein n=1 Tax=Dendrolimus kikuchii TaxID=765133 RepID=A0ACC1D6J6_9NEOP|nr:hypothetical protein K1T71_005148 [Dendrolimus kikuchii]
MFARRVSVTLFSKKYQNTQLVPHRNVQVSIAGAASDIGSNVALLLKQNMKVRRLQLYDDDDRVKGIGYELGNIPGGPLVSVFAGDRKLGPAIRSSEIVLMVARLPRNPGKTREQMMAANAPNLEELCRAVAEHNQDAFLAISTNPINSIIPFASSLLYKYNCYNPLKVFGITHIDSARSRAFAANAINASARELNIPVIGGHSDETIIPLFSNLTPSHLCIDQCLADTLTRLVRKAGTDVVTQKHGHESATLAMAWSINEFVDNIIDAVNGSEVVVSSYTANPNFGTRFFAGPTIVGADGIIQTCCNLPMNELECYLLNCSIPIINKEIAQGEDFVNYIESIRKK